MVGQSRTRLAWRLLAPTLFVMCVVALWPLARSIWFSFTDTHINAIDQIAWVGLANYFGEFGLWKNSTYTEGFWASDWGVSIRNTFWFATISVALETLLGLGVALLLNQEFRGRALVRTAVLVPWAIPTIVSAKMWQWLLHDQFGLINEWLLRAKIITQKIAWTADNATAMGSVIAVDVWKTTPFMALLILAALQTVPKECYEAAKIDGAGPIRSFWKITLPLIRNAIVVAVVFRLLDALRVFDLIFVLTSNNSATISMSGYVRREMVESGNIGLGSAGSTSLFLIIFLTAILFMKLARVKLSNEGTR